VAAFRRNSWQVYSGITGRLRPEYALELIIDWYSFIQKNIISNDINFIDKLSSENIRNIYQQFHEDKQVDSTIYHFGFDLKEMKFIGFAYRSKNNFISEKLIYSIGIKPPDEVEDFGKLLMDGSDIYSNIIKLIIKQKEIDDKKDIKDKVGIGGSVHIFTMKSNSYYFSESYYFEDYEQIFKEMLNTVRSLGGTIL